MRLIAVFFTGSAVADDWKDYDNAEYSFAIHFSANPTVDSITYQAANGRSFNAHTFSVQQETGVFTAFICERSPWRRSSPLISAQS